MQIWIAMISFLLLKYLSDSSSSVWTVGSLMAVIPILLFMKKDLWLWLNKPKPMAESMFFSDGQMGLFL
ncbi:hypothetical protein [Oceanispirochaeta sp. M1]|uniref:hypothetical protein n=1 Tax=Oceanispirochaeta sp. M1 TaxID=2283433 RepID=UPI000E0981BB|nr:hypothetical protein DV872_09300 [Oceanispirochaeta sp. M1]